MLTQSGILTNGKTYKYSIDIISSTLSSQNIRVYLGGTDYITHTLNGGAETISAYGQSVGSNLVIRVTSANTSGILTIDNVSVKQVDPNDRWILETGWSYGDNRLNFSGGSSNRACYSNIGITNGKTYKLSFNVLSISAGQVSLRFGGMAGVDEITATSTGIHSGIITANSSAIGTVQIEDNDNNFVGSITDVSIVEVQGDRPRLSYDITNGVVEDKPHLLLENSSTNLVTFSEDFSQSYWIKSGASITSGFVSPDGTNNAYKLVEDSANSRHFINSTGFSTPDTVYSASLFVKANGRNKIAFRENSITGNYASFNLSNGTVIATNGVSASIELMFNGWYRINYQITSGSSYILGIELLSDSYTSGDPFSNPYQGDGSSGILIYGAQVESQSYATSYIPTAGTTITRAAETCNNSKPSVNSTEGVLYCEIANIANDLTNKKISISDDTTSNSVLIFYTNVNNAIQCKVTVGGTASMNHYFSISDVTSFSKLALKWKANDFAIWLDGSEVHTDTSGGSFSAGTLTTVNFDRGDGGEDFYGKVKGLAVYNEALSESQLMQLTGVTASSIYNNFVTRTASFTVEALNEVKKVIDNL